MSATSFRTITLPAGSASNPGIVTEVVSGRFYATVATTGLFYVRANQGATIEQNAGRRFGSSEGAEFSKLTFYNYTAGDLTVTYYVGPTEYVPDPSVVATISTVTVNVAGQFKNSPTYTKGTSSTVGASGTAFSGTDGTSSRKSFSVFNEEASGSGNNITVRGANGVKGHVVLPQTSYVVEAGGELTLIGSGFSFAVMETFYT